MILVIIISPAAVYLHRYVTIGVLQRVLVWHRCLRPVPAAAAAADANATATAAATAAAAAATAVIHRQTPDVRQLLLLPLPFTASSASAAAAAATAEQPCVPAVGSSDFLDFIRRGILNRCCSGGRPVGRSAGKLS